MRLIHSTLRRLLPGLLCASLFAAGAPVHAADTPPPEPRSEAWCERNAEKCAQMKKAREDYCAKNPQTCETRQGKREARRAYCEQNPDQCDELKHERRARRDELKQRCQENPEACEEKKQELRERRDERRERRREAIDSAQPDSQQP